jgi:NAD(P)-dependent dehydrogenase (short-subunit alcohol dehydrogenase family)
MQIKDNLFIITGAASGLGAATAEMIIGEGGKTILVDLNQEAGETFAHKLGASAKFIKADVSREDSAQEVFKVAKQWGQLRGLINCAGIAPAAKVLGKEGPHSLEIFSKTIQVNLIGSFNMCRLAAELISTQEPNEDHERGVLINTASVAAYEGQIGQAAYAASKGGVVSMVIPMARELARQGIRVLGIAPGIMETPMLMSFPKHVQDALGQTVPFPQRMGKPSEYADLVRYMLSNNYLNGEVIRLDGAIRLTAK